MTGSTVTPSTLTSRNFEISPLPLIARLPSVFCVHELPAPSKILYVTCAGAEAAGAAVVDAAGVVVAGAGSGVGFGAGSGFGVGSGFGSGFGSGVGGMVVSTVNVALPLFTLPALFETTHLYSKPLQFGTTAVVV